MVISHKKLDLWSSTLIETISIRPPYFANPPEYPDGRLAMER